MGCRNCNFTGSVALTNNDGQVYEYRICPECVCKHCNGTGTVYVQYRDHLQGHWLAPCPKCQAVQQDAHVHTYLKHKSSLVDEYERRYGKNGTMWEKLLKTLRLNK